MTTESVHVLTMNLNKITETKWKMVSKLRAIPPFAHWGEKPCCRRDRLS